MIYFDLDKDIIKHSCDFKFYYNNTDVILTVLDGGNEIILANWPDNKHIICTINNDIPITILILPYIFLLVDCCEWALIDHIEKRRVHSDLWQFQMGGGGYFLSLYILLIGNIGQWRVDSVLWQFWMGGGVSFTWVNLKNWAHLLHRRSFHITSKIPKNIYGIPLHVAVKLICLTTGLWICLSKDNVLLLLQYDTGGVNRQCYLVKLKIWEM